MFEVAPVEGHAEEPPPQFVRREALGPLLPRRQVNILQQVIDVGAGNAHRPEHARQFRGGLGPDVRQRVTRRIMHDVIVFLLPVLRERRGGVRPSAEQAVRTPALPYL